MATSKANKKTEQSTSEDMLTSTETNSENPMLQLGGLWVNDSKNGNKYMSGYLGNLKIMVFRNNYKTEDKHPDYVMYLTEKPRNNENSDEQNKDDIPF